MATEADPIVGSWYKHLDKGQHFQVVAVDENELLIEIQDFDGDIEEIDIDDWYLMDLEQIESPEDISGALDVSESDDLCFTAADDGYPAWNASPQEPSNPNGPESTEGMVELYSLDDETSYEEAWDDI